MLCQRRKLNYGAERMEPPIVHSPLWGVAYDAPREHELLLVAELPIDRAIREFVRGFVSASAPQRQELTTHLTWEDNDRRSLEFSKRSAVFALRGNSEQHLADAFDALGIAVFQVRDPASLPLVVVAVATRLGANLSALYDAAERVASGSSPRMLTQIRRSYPQGVSLEEIVLDLVAERRRVAALGCVAQRANPSAGPRRASPAGKRHTVPVWCRDGVYVVTTDARAGAGQATVHGIGPAAHRATRSGRRGALVVIRRVPSRDTQQLSLCSTRAR